MFLSLATFLARLVSLDGGWLVPVHKPHVDSGEEREATHRSKVTALPGN